LRNASIVVLSILTVLTLFRLADAGTLTPSTAPAGTMNTTGDAYNALVGTYDSSAVVGSRNGNALQISKCIISKLAGSPCP
jgi:hypothetical protein